MYFNAPISDIWLIRNIPEHILLMHVCVVNVWVWGIVEEVESGSCNVLTVEAH